MPEEQTQLLVTLLVLGFVYAGLGLVGSVIYDFGEIRKQKSYKKNKHNKMFKKRKKISVVIFSGGEGKQINRTLKSIAKNNYRKYEIVVVSNNDSECSLEVESFKKLYPKKKIILISNKINRPEEILLKQAQNNSSGEIIFLLKANQTISKNALQDIFISFAYDSEIKSITTNLKRFDAAGLTELAQVNVEFMNKRFKKLRNVLKQNRYTQLSINNPTAILTEAMIASSNERSRQAYLVEGRSLYSHKTIVSEDINRSNDRHWVRSLTSNKISNIRLVGSVQDSSSISKRMLSRFLYLISQLAPAESIIYLLFVVGSVIFMDPIIFTAGWAVSIIIFITTVISDSSLNFFEKIRTAIYAPILYILFSVWCVVQVLNIYFLSIRYIYNFMYKSLSTKNRRESDLQNSI